MQRWLNKQGDGETLDPTPVEMPADMEVPRTLEEIVGTMLAQEMARVTDDAGFDSWEESQDFDDDDPDLLDFTRFEMSDLDGGDDIEALGDPLDPENPLFLPNPDGEAAETAPRDREADDPDDPVREVPAST
jgi:hypothetical protein